MDVRVDRLLGYLLWCLEVKEGFEAGRNVVPMGWTGVCLTPDLHQSGRVRTLNANTNGCGKNASVTVSVVQCRHEDYQACPHSFLPGNTSLLCTWNSGPTSTSYPRSANPLAITFPPRSCPSCPIFATFICIQRGVQLRAVNTEIFVVPHEFALMQASIRSRKPPAVSTLVSRGSPNLVGLSLLRMLDVSETDKAATRAYTSECQ